MSTTLQNGTKYHLDQHPKLEKVFEKLARRDPVLFIAVDKKITQILENPYSQKPLKRPLKGRWRAHVGSFVITYRILEERRIVQITDFDHHDQVYEKRR